MTSVLVEGNAYEPVGTTRMPTAAASQKDLRLALDGRPRLRATRRHIPRRKSSLPLLQQAAASSKSASKSASESSINSESKSSPILKLPPELIRQIASLLPQTTAAVFTFTCTTIRTILGTQYWDAFNDDLRAREHLIRVWLSLPHNLQAGVHAHGHFPRVPNRCIFSHLDFVSADAHQRCTLLPRGSSLITLEAFQKKLKPRRRLLELLGRDVPDMIRCGRCVMLHRPGRRVPARDDSELRECEAVDQLMGVGRIVYPGFTFPHVQLAMKLHRSAHGAKSREYLDSLASCTTSHSMDLTHINKTKVQFRISNDEIYMRTQYQILFPVSSIPYFSLTQLLDTSNIPSQICAHLSFGDHRRNRLASHVPDLDPNLPDNTKSGSEPSKKYLDDILRCRLSHSQAFQRDCRLCAGLHQCKYCETELSIEVKQMIGGCLGVLVTKWAALGNGTTCSDAKWERHFERGEDTFVRKERLEWVAGAIRDAFDSTKVNPRKEMAEALKEGQQMREEEMVLKKRVQKAEALLSDLERKKRRNDKKRERKDSWREYAFA